MRITKEILDNLFKEYKNNINLSMQKLADRLNLDRTTIGKYFQKYYGGEYEQINRNKNKNKKRHTIESKIKVSLALKGKRKPTRSLEHRLNLSKAFKGRSYKERFGEERAKKIKEKIILSNKNRIHFFKNKEEWRKKLSNSLKGRIVWNKGKKGLQKAWNKIDLPKEEIINKYLYDGKSSIQIANEFNTSKNVILRFLKENNIPRKNSLPFIKDKTYEEIYGPEKAKLLKENISKRFKGRKCTWKEKISEGIKRYYKENGFPEERRNEISERSRNLWKNLEYKNKLIKKHIDYLKNHPEELERLKKIQFPGGITKIEKRMLEFLKTNFKEGIDFYFDKQDITGKTFYRPDFQFPKQKIIIELNGYYKHYTKEGYKRDKIREYYLKKAGWKVYNFNFYDIDRNYKFEKVKKQVIDIIQDVNLRN